jgi:hypothetical protein
MCSARTGRVGAKTRIGGISGICDTGGAISLEKWAKFTGAEQ